jgi:hypothetical protein
VEPIPKITFVYGAYELSAPVPATYEDMREFFSLTAQLCGFSRSQIGDLLREEEE